MYSILRMCTTLKTKELMDDKIIKNWFSGIKATNSTKKSYLQAMQGYTDHTNKSPLQLIEEAEHEIKAGLLMRERSITTHLMEYREGLEAQDLAPLTVKGRMTGICSFYKYYNIQLPVIPKSTKNARPQLKRKQIPTKDDIRAILQFCDPLERALMLVGVSSGLSAIDISNLRVRDFLEGYDPISEITTLHLIRQKMDYEFYTFLSPEASKAVKDYLDYRGRTTKDEGRKRDNQLEKQHVTTRDGYLFVRRAIPDEYLKLKEEKEREKLRKLDEKSIVAIYQRLNIAAQKSASYGEYNIIRSHNLRRFFNSTLLSEHAQLFFVDFLLGHKLDATHEAYYRANPESLKEEYKKYVPYITIEKALDIAESPEYLKIKQENQILQTETARHVVERSELQELRAEIEKMKDTESIKADYMQFADVEEIREMKNSLKQELEEVSKLKEMMLKAGK